MGDGHQLLPPVWWRGWRQRQIEASRVSASRMNSFDVICLAGGKGVYERTWYDHGLEQETMCFGLVLHDCTLVKPLLSRKAAWNEAVSGSRRLVRLVSILTTYLRTS